MTVLCARSRRPFLTPSAASPSSALHAEQHGEDTAHQEHSQHSLPQVLPLLSSPGSRRYDSSELLLQSTCERGYLHTAIHALSYIHTPLSIPTYLSLLKACIKNKSLPLVIHTRLHLAIHKVPLTGFLGDYLVMTLAKCGAVDDARLLSATLSHLTVFSWTAIIFAYAESGRGEEALEAYQQMLKDAIDPDSFTFVSLFKACGSIPDIKQGRTLHTHARSMGFATHTFVGNTIVSMYGKCGALTEAEDAFTALSHRDTVSWNGMLSAYVEQRQGEKGLLLYRQMCEEGMIADVATFVIVFQACAILAEEEGDFIVRTTLTKQAVYEIGQALHADARKRNLSSHYLVGTAILSMYAKCGSDVEAEHVFGLFLHLDTIAWNAMLSAYVEQEQGDKALSLYTHMQKQGASPDHLTYLIALQACAVLGQKVKFASDGGSSNSSCLEVGQALHSDVRCKGYTTYAPIANTLVSMYGKCGAIAEAEEVFSGMSECDVVSWNAMLSVYSEQGKGEKSLSLYRTMQEQQVILNDVTFLCILQACSEADGLEVCKNVHFGIIFAGFDKMLPLTATLVNAYGSSASIADAEVIFENYAESSVVMWNAFIAGHAGDSNFLGSLRIFDNMRLAGFKADKVTFTSVLSACSHSGLVVEGLEYMSIDSSMTGECTHRNIVMDLLGRAGDFTRVESLLKRMPVQADPAIWLSLLGACSAHGNLELAKHAFDQAVLMEPKQAAAYVLMANIYADAGLPNWTQL